MKRRTFLSSLGITAVASLLCNFKVAGSKSPVKDKVWTAADIQGGLYVTKKTFNDDKRIGYGCTVTSQIGYILSPRRYNGEIRSMGKRYCLNSFADGWVYNNLDELFTKEELAAHLNEAGYRPSTKEEIHKMIDSISKNFV